MWHKKIEARKVGERIRGLREARKMTQQQVAEKSGVSQETISRLESGAKEMSNPTIELLNGIAKALKVDTIELFEKRYNKWGDEIVDTMARDLIKMLEGMSPGDIELLHDLGIRFTKQGGLFKGPQTERIFKP